MGIRIEFSPHLLKLMDAADQAFFQPGVHPPYEEDHHPPQKSDKLERDEQRSFANWCLLKDYPMVWHGTHKATTANAGVPDFLVWVNRTSLAIEFKRVGAKLSPDQETWRKRFEAQGFIYFVVYSHPEAIALTNKYDRVTL
jgi:hypothetical protein